MTDEVVVQPTAEQVALAAAGSKAPVVNDGKKPDKAALDEEHGTPADKAKAEADKKAKDAEALAAEAKAKEGETAETAEEKEAREAAEAEEANDGEWTKNWQKTGNPDADAAMVLLKDSGVSVIEANAIFSEAIKAKDLSKVKWDVLEAKIGIEKTRLVKNGVEKFDRDVVQKATATVALAHAAAGGQAQWDAVVKWAHAQEKADKGFAAELVDIRAGMEIGGTVAKNLASDLVARYNKDPKNKGTGNAKIVKGEKVSQDAGGAPITSREDYMTQLKAAQNKGDFALVAQLRARRRAAMQAAA